MVLDPSLMAPKFRRVHRHEPRTADPAGDGLGGAGDEPVVGVHEIELVPVCELERELAHVSVHRADPADKRADVLGELRLADAVDDHAVALLLRRQAPAATRQHVDFDAVADKVL